MAYTKIIRSKTAEISVHEEKKKKSIPFINDELDSSLDAVLVTAHLALMNQLIKAGAGSNIEHYKDLTSTGDINNFASAMKEIREQSLSLSHSLVSIISSSSLQSILEQLAMNDKELLTTLLDASELELRLIHQLTIIHESEGDKQASDVDGTASAVPSQFDRGGSDLNTAIIGSTTTKYSSSNKKSRCNSSTSSDKVDSSKISSCGSSGDHDINMMNMSAQLLHQLKMIRFDSMSSFFLFLSSCINYDATLFFDYLCSPETSALKYALRITKKLLGFQEMFSSQYFPLSFYRNKMTWKWGRRCGSVFNQRQRDAELMMICTNIVNSQKTDLQCNGAKGDSFDMEIGDKEDSDHAIISIPSTSQKGCSNVSKPLERSGDNPAQSKTVVWLKYEESFFLHDHDVLECFTDESLWGDELKRSKTIQNIHPSEWTTERRRMELDHVDLENREEEHEIRLNGQGCSSLSNKVDYNNDDNANENDDEKEIENAKEMEMENDDDIDKAITMNDSILKFFIKLQLLLIQGQNKNTTVHNIPFDCTLLKNRIKKIILLMAI